MLNFVNNLVLCTYILQLGETIQAAKKAQKLPTLRLGDQPDEVEIGGESEEEDVLQQPPNVEDNQLPELTRPRRRKRPAEALGRNPEVMDPDAPEQQTRLVTAQRMEERLDRLLQVDPNPLQAEKTNWGLWLAAVSANIPDDRFPEFMNRTWALCSEFGNRWSQPRQSSTTTQPHRTTDFAQSSGSSTYQTASYAAPSTTSPFPAGSSSQGAQYVGQYESGNWSQQGNMSYSQLQTPRPSGNTPTGMHTSSTSLGGLSIDSTTLGQCMSMSLLSPTSLAQGDTLGDTSQHRQ
jgi:hypothetical protein